jgi:hypothetical protein
MEFKRDLLGPFFLSLFFNPHKPEGGFIDIWKTTEHCVNNISALALGFITIYLWVF